MAITVKRLIKELEQIDNQFLEVEVRWVGRSNKQLEIETIVEENRKLVIYSKEPKK